MAIPSSGAVSFSDLRTEFVGGSAAISISSLYRGGSNIRTKASNNNGVNLAASVPTSGTITLTTLEAQQKRFAIHTLLVQPIRTRVISSAMTMLLIIRKRLSLTQG